MSASARRLPAGAYPTGSGQAVAPLRRAPASAGLYASVLGAAAADLAPQVRSLHVKRCCTRATGVLTVRRGVHPLARILAPLLRLPPAGAAVPIGLEIARHGGQEWWWRRFADGPVLASRQGSADGVLVERYGLVELRFAMRVVLGALDLRSTGTRLAAGGVRVALPSWLTPQVHAVAAPAGPHGVRVRVRIRLPSGPLLLAYDGTVEEDDRG